MGWGGGDEVKKTSRLIVMDDTSSMEELVVHIKQVSGWIG